MKYFFTADTHFGHANIIKYCNRPFASIQEMDEAIIRNWNKVVGDADMVFHLGDFCFGTTSKDFHRYFKQLRGRIVFIKGNHDKLAWRCRHDFLAAQPFGIEQRLNEQDIVLCHYAMRTWNKSHYGSWHLYGHTHGFLPDDSHSLSIDVGVDCHNYTPINFEQVAELMKKKFFVPLNKSKRDASGGVGLPKADFEKETRQRLFFQLKKEFEQKS